MPGPITINAYCEDCLYSKQLELTDDEEYLSEVRKILAERGELDSPPYMVYLFDKEYERRFGKRSSFAAEKKEYNDLVLSMEDEIRQRIMQADDPLIAALACSRAGNYIDFGTMNNVSHEEFLKVLFSASFSEEDLKVYRSFEKQLEEASSFLLIADNCGEIVLDRLFIEQLKKRFPALECSVMVRGAETINDVTREDAVYAGIDRVAEIVSNGKPLAGTVIELLSDEAKNVLESADVILAKGQGNYETMGSRGIHAFYLFLCKCDLFTRRFNVPKLTGMFIEEAADI